MDKWIRTDKEKPPINWIDKFEAEHKISISVLVFMDDSKFYFGKYYYNEHDPHWSIQGYLGFDQKRITHWQYLYPPEQIFHTQEEINGLDNWVN